MRKTALQYNRSGHCTRPHEPTPLRLVAGWRGMLCICVERRRRHREWGEYGRTGLRAPPKTSTQEAPKPCAYA